MIAKSGEFKLPIDFENVEFTAPAVLIVFPEQVHNIIEVKDPKGWFIAFDPSLVDKEVLQFLENTLIIRFYRNRNLSFFNSC